MQETNTTLVVLDFSSLNGEYLGGGVWAAPCYVYTHFDLSVYSRAREILARQSAVTVKLGSFSSYQVIVRKACRASVTAASSLDK